VKRRGKSSPSALKAEHGKPHLEQGQAEPMGSLPPKGSGRPHRVSR